MAISLLVNQKLQVYHYITIKECIVPMHSYCDDLFDMIDMDNKVKEAIRCIVSFCAKLCIKKDMYTIGIIFCGRSFCYTKKSVPAKNAHTKRSNLSFLLLCSDVRLTVFLCTFSFHRRFYHFPE